MTPDPAAPGALSPYRVLDLTDGLADLGPMILADLGADVIKVEPPGGSPSRRAPPLDATLPPALASLRFHAFNRNKRSVVLDLETAEGQADFERLVASADILFENDEPGAMAARGLGFEDLRAVNPRLVYVAITPFGQDGPYAGYAAADLTLSALSGQMAVYGDADRPPVRISVPQAWLHAAGESAVGAMVALHRRERTGSAQFVDVSVQAALVLTAVNATIAFAVQGRNIERNGSKVQLGTITQPTVFPCADGYVVLFSQNLWPVFVRWMVEAGEVPDSWLADVNWATFFPDHLSGKPLAHSYEELVEHAAAFAARHPAQALFARGLADGVFVAPVNTVADVLAFDHLAARGYWQPLALPDGRTLRAPGAFVRLGRTPIAHRHPAPALGAHTAEVLSDAPPAPPPAPRPAPSDEEETPLPFAGLKVADFSWVGVGPLTAKYLADHGATVVRVETSSPPDILRVGGPFKDGVFGPNRSHFFGMCNSSKWSLALNLKQEQGRAIAKRLMAWADVCFESFTPGTMAALGLGYETARAINPGLIMVSTCLMGQTGPAAALAGYGTHAAAISGFVDITGWPDRAPAGPYAAYTDLVAPRFLAAAVMAAIDYRRRTGEGQYIEQSQMESALYFLAPEILDYQASGELPRRMGNAATDAAPYGVYPCAGDDQWCAIAVETDAQWRSLRQALGGPAWAADPALDTVAGRLARCAVIDAHLGEWTRVRTPREAMEQLQAAGVPAGAVHRSSDLLRDPQLAHRRFFRPLIHPEMGEVPYEGHQFRIRGYDSGPRFAAPCLGEHTYAVLHDLLGMTEEEIAEVMASDALV
jgi:crotonobetainyl-CoA:carnitine CoA-transferase CaiB-like acyl-CoA transferase